MIAVVVGVTLLYQAMPVDDDKATQDRDIAKLHAAIAGAEMTNKRLMRERDALIQDSEYAGLLARDRLNLMRDGETILRVDQSK